MTGEELNFKYVFYIAGHAVEEWLKNQNNLLSLLMHEIRGPLSTLATSSYLLRKGGLDHTSNPRILDTIDRQIRHLNALMESITELTRYRLEKSTIPQSVIPVQQVLGDALENCQHSLAQKSIKVSLNQPQQNLRVSGSQGLLCQIFVNLIRNAAKFSSRNSSLEISAQ